MSKLRVDVELRRPTLYSVVTDEGVIDTSNDMVEIAIAIEKAAIKHSVEEVDVVESGGAIAFGVRKVLKDRGIIKLR